MNIKNKLSCLFLLVSLYKAEAQSSALSIADSLYVSGNYTKAINYYAKIGDQKSSLQIARAYNIIGNYDKAIAQYENLVAKATNLQIARFELGKLYFKTKKFDKSRLIFSDLVRDAPDNPEYFYYRGESFQELEQPASSIVAYKKAIAIDSTHLRSLFRLGKYFVVKHETSQALLYIDKGLEFYENDVSFLNLKTLALFNNDEYEKAVPFFERLIELREEKKHIYTKLAYSYFKTWQFEKAKATYRILIALDDENEDAYFNLGHVFYKDRQIDSAKYYVKKSMEVQKISFAREYGALAGFARGENDFKAAFEYYKLAYNEDASDYRNYYQICTLADQIYEDPKVKLKYYENFIAKFDKKNKPQYFFDMVRKRISQLKEEIHFTKD